MVCLSSNGSPHSNCSSSECEDGSSFGSNGHSYEIGQPKLSTATSNTDTSKQSSTDININSSFPSDASGNSSFPTDVSGLRTIVCVKSSAIRR